MTAANPIRPHPLVARRLALNSPEYRSIQAWPFPDEPFYVRQVRRMLLADIPQRVLFGNCAVWGYVDPEAGRELVGFGTIDVSGDHSAYTGGLPHTYIPLLSVRPGVQSYGYGQSIVEHLVAEAAVALSTWKSGETSTRLFLDVYAANTRAIRLYADKCGFTLLNPDHPIPDHNEGNEGYFIMARDVGIAPAPGTD